MRIVGLSGLVAALVLVTGCESTIGGTAVASHAGADQTAANQADADHSCAQVSAPMTPIEPRSTAEFQLTIPQPDGWVRDTKMDSQIIRFVMVDRDLTTDHFAPNAVVTFESLAHPTQTAREMLDDLPGALKQGLGATDVTSADITQCGYPAIMIDYTAPSMGPIPTRRQKALGVVMESGDTFYHTTVTIGSTDSQNPTYIKDSETIFKGFAITAPTG
jgi:hypothetical protein